MKIRKWRVVVLAVVLGGLLLTPTSAAGDDVSSLRAELSEALHSHSDGGTGDRAPLNKNIEQVGFLGFAPREISDVWAHGNYAYLAGLDGSPVKVVDISDPSDPFVVDELFSPDPSCSTQDVKVDKISTPFFNGDLLAVGGEGCFTGLQLWDVTDPTNATLLSASNELGDPEFIHNVYIFEQQNRAYVAAVSSFNEIFTPFGDLLIVDVTDPTDPFIAGDWGAGKDGGLAFGSPIFGLFGFPPPFDCTPPPGGDELCRGDDFPGVFGHDVWVNEQGTLAYVSYWDAGVVILDISDPANPTLEGLAFEPETFSSDEGNAHVAVPARGGNLLLVGDEDFTAGPWGFIRIFDTSDPANPVEVGAFATENAISAPEPTSEGFSAHNIIVRGNRAYLSWYDDGVVVMDFSNPKKPREIAAFTPGGSSSFWGVYVHENLVLGSDYAGGGLYILKVK